MMNHFAEWRDTVIEKVAELKRTDKKFRFFGARKHRYTFDAPISIAEAEQFEHTYAIQLPAEYKYFITQIGNGGAGPYYGVRPLQDFQAHYVHHEVELPAMDLHKPFPAHYWLNENETRITKEIVQQSVFGTMSICEEGDGYNHLLVVAGDEKGYIWFDGSVTDQGMIPFSMPEKERFTFFDWYESWLNMAFDELF
ncbi:SMI1/KNR4 family protein [Dyadobacter sp. CY343]|uniref:SMI1/KNR4 family protein n=1 Tax=Dyadobacter sp. CY343 TaxID=2907299 RepID=UPI001F308200|nr:SMI1/KNR4 family protein [Dyadobacter sp. CY343]MCE7061993.1 SMI1/KNR4 family protein [Dyadobacter sp. CY343]